MPQAHLYTCQIESMHQHSEVDSKDWDAAHSAAVDADCVQSMLHCTG